MQLAKAPSLPLPVSSHNIFYHLFCPVTILADLTSKLTIVNYRFVVLEQVVLTYLSTPQHTFFFEGSIDVVVIRKSFIRKHQVMLSATIIDFPITTLFANFSVISMI